MIHYKIAKPTLSHTPFNVFNKNQILSCTLYAITIGSQVYFLYFINKKTKIA